LTPTKKQAEQKSYNKIRYDEKPFQIIDVTSPHGIVHDKQFLYICSTFDGFHVFHLENQKLDNKKLNLDTPKNICFYNNQFYITDRKNVSIFNNNLKLVLSFPLPPKAHVPYITVDDNFIFVTSNATHNVYVYSKEGKLEQTIGSTLKNPLGLTTNQNTLYVCDCGNHQIQTFLKNEFTFENKWGRHGTEHGQFDEPETISYCVDVLYVGDKCSIQLFTIEGSFLQRIAVRGKQIGGFMCGIQGICIRNNELYVSDCGNDRIQVFRRVHND